MKVTDTTFGSYFATNDKNIILQFPSQIKRMNFTPPPSDLRFEVDKQINTCIGFNILLVVSGWQHSGTILERLLRSKLLIY